MAEFRGKACVQGFRNADFYGYDVFCFDKSHDKVPFKVACTHWPTRYRAPAWVIDLHRRELLEKAEEHDASHKH